MDRGIIVAHMAMEIRNATRNWMPQNGSVCIVIVNVIEAPY